ncbi:MULTISPECIES: hydrolase [unclassified Streptomyces]|uniref:hydrolase n=1 Tax=unclassified Streptomyces TaxID=2593676 RepID=UPI0016553F7D|nr:hydrolase [Streptomyces sp. CB02980]MCB8903930.1 hydrolase [Streptomyces sp. CB02980]
MEPIAIGLPAEFWTVRYDGSRFPGSAAVAARPGLAAGANCQVFAYEVLRHFGLAAPDLRSSELWSDTGVTAHVPVARPLDLVLFNSTADAYGAHVGVHVGDDAILHLCAEVGHPAVWGPADFAARERYAVRLGAKRVLPQPAGGVPINTSTGTR